MALVEVTCDLMDCQFNANGECNTRLIHIGQDGVCETYTPKAPTQAVGAPPAAPSGPPAPPTGAGLTTDAVGAPPEQIPIEEIMRMVG